MRLKERDVSADSKRPADSSVLKTVQDNIAYAAACFSDFNLDFSGLNKHNFFLLNRMDCRCCLFQLRLNRLGWR